MRANKKSANTISKDPVITHPEKLMFPASKQEEGITKGDLAAYYEMIAPYMLPHIAGRPITMERFYRGIAAPGFFQKDVNKGFPEWLERAEVPKKDGVVHHPLANNVRSLLWLANQNAITLHVWTSRAPDLFHPDICVFDLDPAADDPPAVRKAALQLRDLLAELALRSWVKTSGSKGFHIAVPLKPQADFGQVATFAHKVAKILVSRDPSRLTLEFSKSDRGGRILVDTARNGYSATFAAPYTVRAKPGAPISAPCTWEELEREKVSPRTFTLRMMTTRIAAVGDLWTGIDSHAQSIPKKLPALA